MAYLPVPKDLTAVKTKVMFNLTKRQLICFGSGALIGVPLFFILKSHISTSAATICMVLVMVPSFLMAMYEKHGLPLESAAETSYRAGRSAYRSRVGTSSVSFASARARKLNHSAPPPFPKESDDSSGTPNKPLPEHCPCGGKSG
jgi:hypothetical protein